MPVIVLEVGQEFIFHIPKAAFPAGIGEGSETDGNGCQALLTIHDDVAVLTFVLAVLLLHDNRTNKMRRDGFRVGSVGDVLGNVLYVIPEWEPLFFASPSVGALELG